MTKTEAANQKTIQAVWIFAVLVCFMSILAVGLTLRDNSEPTVFVFPSNVAVRANQSFAVSVNVSGASDVYGWEFKLGWNTSLLEMVNITESSFLNSSRDTYFVPKIMSADGYVLAGCTSLRNVPGVDGNGTLATVEFRATALGSCTLVLYDTKLVTSSLQLETHNSNDGYVRVAYPVTFDQLGLDPTATGTTAIIDGEIKTYTDLPFTEWVDNGSTVTYSFNDTIMSTVNGKRFKLVSVNGPASPITVTALSAITGNYKTQYYLTVASPHDSSNPTSGWFDSDSNVTASVSSPVAGGAGIQYVCTGWSGSGSVPASGSEISTTFIMIQASAITWNWKTQYIVMFSQSGLDSSTSGTVVTVDGGPVTYGSLPYVVWVDNGASTSYCYYNVSSSTPGEQFILVGVTSLPSPITVTSPIAVTGNYKTQYQVTFTQTGVDSDFAGTVLTVDSNAFAIGSLPASFWWDNASIHTFSFCSPLMVTENELCYWFSTTGMSTLQNDSLTITGSGIVEGAYVLQYSSTVPVADGKNAIVNGNVTITSPLVTGGDLSFDVSGPPGSVGWVNVTFPMVNSTAIGVSVDGAKLVPPPYPIITSNGTHYFIYFEMPLSTHTITIQYGSVDIAIGNVTLSKTVVGQGYSMWITTNIRNNGDFDETFNVTVYANTTAINQTQITLTSRNSTISSFIWNTTGFAYGNYTLSAYAWPVPGETNTVDNNFSGGWVTVSLVGDIMGPTGWPDDKVDMRDIGLVARNFGQTVPPANANCDVTGPTLGVPDGKIDMRDIGLVARHFGDHYP